MLVRPERIQSLQSSIDRLSGFPCLRSDEVLYCKMHQTFDYVIIDQSMPRLKKFPVVQNQIVDLTICQ
jgi:hypothetical protein